MASDPLAACRVGKGESVEQYLGYPANAAIAIKSGVAVLTKAGVGVMTLANPISGQPESGGDDGKILRIMSTTAQAHTVTNPAGFNNGGAASDVATFGAAIGNNMVVLAYQGRWYVVSQVGVTLA